MVVPLVDLKAQYMAIKPEIDSAIQDVLDSTSFIMGPKLGVFEGSFASAIGVKYVIGTSSGTAALMIALKALGIGPGDDVIVPVNTFIATSEAASNAGANVVFADIDEDTFNIDAGKIEERITSRTKAIIPVHLYGQCADMEKIMEIAKKYKLLVVEDCAQAHLAECTIGSWAKKAGAIGNAACFSFFPCKNLGAYGDAGCISTNSSETAEKAAMLLNHGRKKGDKYIHSIEGYNERMDTLQAAVLDAKLKHLAEWTEKRRKNAKIYNKLLSSLAASGKIKTPFEKSTNKHVYHLYVIKVLEGKEKREKLAEFLKQNGISTSVHYPIPLHKQPAYKNYGAGSRCGFLAAEKTAEQILSLPMYPELAEEQIKFIAEKIKEFFAD